MIGQWTNHLWQSTLFAVVAALLTFIFRNNRAHVRYWLWLIASVKFLVPFALLINLGNSLSNAFAAKQIEPRLAPAVSLTLQQITVPFTNDLSFVHSAPLMHTRDWIPIAILSVWICGFLGVVLVRFRGWWRIRKAICASTPVDIQIGTAVRSFPGLLEPGVVGLLNPILLLPDAILKQMPQSELDSVIAHELSHVRRRDNLTAAIHMIVEAVFWFHPFVWWIGARLLEERERACDEAVLSLGGEPRDYADAIVNVCKLYTESPLTCASGMSGADLKKRIVRIMACHVGLRMSLGRKLLLGTVGVLAIVAPVAEGLAGAFHLHAQLLIATSDSPSFEVATIKPSRSNEPLNFKLSPARFEAKNVSLMRLILMAYNVKSDDQLPKGPNWMSSEKFDIDAKIADTQVDAMKKLPPDQRFDQYRLMVQSLLAGRFKLKVSTELKDLPVYALIVEKIRPGLTPTPPPAGEAQGQHMPTLEMPSKGELKADSVTMKFFTDQWLWRNPELGGRVVIDSTGLQGGYDFTLKWSPVDLSAAPPDANVDGRASNPTTDSSGPSLFTALQEQLGLKLEPRKAPVDVLVIDHVEKPSPN
jgi:uncharacterized protein (TIGR03435 family)